MQSFLKFPFWLSPGLCPVRLAGDLCLAVSTPWLLFTLHKNGSDGMSVETQILRLIMFVTRYLDLFVDGKIVSTYNTAMKIIFTATSFLVVGSLLFRYKAYSLASKKLLYLPLLFAGCLASLITYNRTALELAWAFSQYLGAVANIPQLMLFVYPKNRDWRMNVYVALLAGYRAFYVPHWVLRYLTWGALDPISVLAGVLEISIFFTAFGAALLNSKRRSQSQSQDPEAGSLKTLYSPDATSLGPQAADLVETPPPVDLKPPV